MRDLGLAGERSNSYGRGGGHWKRFVRCENLGMGLATCPEFRLDLHFVPIHFHLAEGMVVTRDLGSRKGHILARGCNI